MTEIQQNRYDRLVRRVNNIVSPGSMVGDALNELFPMIDVENLPAELYALSGTALCFGGGVVAAVVGEAGRMQIFNPTDSSVVLTVTKAIPSIDSGTATLRWGITSTPLATDIGTNVFRDTRLGLDASSRPVGQIRTMTSVALANATGQARTLSNSPFVVEDENSIAVLLPGSGFEIGIQALNAKFFCTLYWRERVFEPAEISF